MSHQILSSLPGRILRTRTNSFGPLIHTRSKADASKLPQHILNIPPTKTTALKSGLVVATEEQPHAETASIGIWVNTGSGYENDKNNGVAHFLEHMAFKGTAKRSQKALELEVENMGANLNAYTSREQTVFWSKCFNKHVPQNLDILADILQNSAFTQENIERERGVILRESEEIENSTEEVVFDNLHACAFQGTALARPILGPEANIRKISRDDLVEYKKTYYTAPRMVLAAAGGVKHEELVALAEKAFADLSSADNVAKMGEIEYTGSEVRIRNDDMPLAHIAIAVEGVSWTDPDFYTMQFIQTIIGAWDRSVGGAANLSARLAEVVASHKLAHSFSTFMTCYASTGLIGNYMVVPPEKIDALVGEVTDEWQRIANNITPTEVERAKHKLITNTILSLDGNTIVAEEIGRQMLAIGRRIPVSEVILRINDITAADVRRVAGKYFTDVSPTVSAIGPIDDLPDYNIIRGWTYWNRL
jgi:processing peptidase subunit beta